MAIVHEGWTCEKDLRLVSGESKRQGEKLWKEQSENSSLG